MSIFKEQTLGEEIANTISHGLGELLSIAGLVLLVVFASIHGGPWHIVSFSIFGVSMVILYLFSTLMHGAQKKETKDVLRVFDHISIYVLIAGTYTPFCLVALHGSLGWAIFGIEWGLAIIGILMKTVFGDYFIHKAKWVSTLFYVIMGWIIVIGIGPLKEAIGVNGLIWLFIGGACYTLGIIFFAMKKLKYSHFVWHLFVVAGTISHFFAVLLYVLPVEV